MFHPNDIRSVLSNASIARGDLFDRPGTIERHYAPLAVGWFDFFRKPFVLSLSPVQQIFNRSLGAT